MNKKNNRSPEKAVAVQIKPLQKANEINLLRESEAQYRGFIENLAVMFYAAEPRPPYSPIYISPAFEKFGYPLEEWRESLDLWTRILHDDDREWVLSRTEAAMRAREETDFEYRIVARDGVAHWVRDRGSFVRDAQGQVVCWQGVIIDISKRKQAEQALRESEERYRDLFENANDLIYIHDLEGNYISVNHAAERVFGYTREEALRMNFKEIVAPEHLKLARRKLARKIDGAKQSIYEVDCLTKNGGRITIEINSRAIFRDGAAIAVQGIARDVTERRRTEEILKEREEQYRELFENANDLIYTHDLHGNFTSLNRAGEIITGYSRAEALKMNIAQVVAPDYLEAARQMIHQKIKGEPPTTYEIEIVAKQGHRVSLELSTRLIVQKNQPVGVQGIARDITERKQNEQRLLFNASHDNLTNLPNRAKFMRHLEQASKRAECDSGLCFAVLFLDLDRFKLINDSLGHFIGDKLLVAIAERLKGCVRSCDIVARLGGDEFTVLLTSISEPADAVLVAKRFLEKLSAPFKLDDYQVHTSASIGIVVSDEIPRQPEDFLRDADTAMYRAKEAGKARYEIFDREMHIRNMNLVQMENDLRRAIELEEFRVFYQPIVSLSDGIIREFEALIRWQHPKLGLVNPNDFISVAEETGLIVPIGNWILKEACRQTAEWQKTTPSANSLSVSVNLSAKQLMHPNLIAQVNRTLKQTSLNSRYLKLEVTESMVMENSDQAVAVISDLQRHGISISTDDFGTGYSSLSYLHRIPFNRIKIDRSFVNKMDSDRKSEAIVRTILLLGQNLHIETVAEGIETERQLEALRLLGCQTGQGYLFSEPVNAESAARLLDEGLPDTFDKPFIAFGETGKSQVFELDKVQ